MELILLVVIILQLAYTAYKDNLHFKEREKLELKLMSKDVFEYTSVTEKPEKPKAEKKSDEYLDIEDVPVDMVVKAKEKI